MFVAQARASTTHTGRTEATTSGTTALLPVYPYDTWKVTYFDSTGRLQHQIRYVARPALVRCVGTGIPGIFDLARKELYNTHAGWWY